MKSIALTQGKEALVDDADFDWLNQWKWYAYQNRQTYYAARQETVSKGKQRMVKMHRVILELEDDNPTHVDHINHDGLDNQRSNIRIASVQQNALNRTDSKGVYWHKQDERWIAQVEVSGKHFHIGSFDTEEDATYARSKVMPIVNHLIAQLAGAEKEVQPLVDELAKTKRQLAAAQAAIASIPKSFGGAGEAYGILTNLKVKFADERLRANQKEGAFMVASAANQHSQRRGNDQGVSESRKMTTK